MKFLKNIKLIKKMWMLVIIPLVFSSYYVYIGYSKILEYETLSSDLVTEIHTTTILISVADKDLYQILNASYGRVYPVDEAEYDKSIALIEKNMNDVENRTDAIFATLADYETRLVGYIGEDTGLSQKELVNLFNVNYNKWITGINNSESIAEVKSYGDTFDLTHVAIDDLGKIVVKYYGDEMMVINEDAKRSKNYMVLNAFIVFFITSILGYILIYDMKSRIDILLSRLKKAMSLDLAQDGWYALGNDEIGDIDRQIQSTIMSFEKETIIRSNVEHIALIGSWDFDIKGGLYRFSENAAKILCIGTTALT